MEVPRGEQHSRQIVPLRTTVSLRDQLRHCRAVDATRRSHTGLLLPSQEGAFKVIHQEFLGFVEVRLVHVRHTVVVGFNDQVRPRRVLFLF